MKSAKFDSDVAGVAALHEPVRRALYEFVASQGEPVTRDAAARAVGIQRALAAHHLDRLVADGLLDAEFRQLSGRRGPGSGRPSKLYRRSGRQIDVTLPQRRYDLAARILAQAVTDAQARGIDIREALRSTAVARGEELANEARRRAGPRPSRKVMRAAVVEALEDQGFEPAPENGGLILRNCPFHSLAQEYTGLVCGLNLSVMEGLVDGIDGERLRLEPQLSPAPGRCCVVFVPVAS